MGVQMKPIDPDEVFHRVNNVIYYDCLSGLFRWSVSRGRIKSGDIAGSVNVSDGYRYIQVYKTRYAAHRLAWLFVNGEFPPNEIDHINGNRLDNRIENLRSVTAKENRKNGRRPQTNTSGVIGVRWHKRDKNWSAQIGVNGETVHLGCFDSLQKAANARKEAESKHGFHPNHGREK